MPKSRVAGWIATGVSLVLVAVLVLTGVALRGRIAAATGLDRPGGASTIAPSTFPDAPPSPSPTAAPDLQPPAAALEPGPAPQAKTLVDRIARLDTSKLVGPDGKPASIAWQFVDAATGTVIASRNPEQLLTPASNTKTLTVAALFHALDAEHRFETRVTAPDAGTVVLVGGGDPLLTSEPAEAGTHPRPPSLRQLARATAKQLEAQGRTSVAVRYDASWFTEPGWASTWPEGYRNQVTPVSALWADEGKVGGVRQRDPAAAAAHAFATQLGQEGITVLGEPAPGKAGGTQLARVRSLPLHVLAEEAMLRSNNSFTEVLGLQLARATGHPTTFAGATAAIREQLTDLGLWQQGAVLHDSSGLSRGNRVSAAMLAQVNRHLVTEPALTGVLDGLPVAGVTGTLAKRFADDVSRPARGVARAKTGTLSLVSTLAGNTTTDDGALVAFAIMLGGQVDGWEAKVFEERIVGILTSCGCR
ncbi:D-alanyl-D-alanine carboxypeptidase/D-alanyl-D-alanine-endopeptidase [uncultured Tessaracoccus sp.]|uniref:D-alanyl-D-alanine carboxypeptidase/D-alanyl-D-alanine endopeptidase n=1 Tax=uncultured Tessaracoccus sp. TaxID=905023 RepID=UPI0025D304CB|nr:D-alanyl-D-alanine carboxypeptidase/D-alanyl-D-alanine-endopeptidase [uncultured Tessaracoccus sp.]